jgi:3-dehydro-L-gulonate 2-dehydrogenase
LENFSYRAMEIGYEIIRVPADQMKAEFFRILIRLGFTSERAYKCADIFTQNSVDGLSSHGVYRFPRFVASVREGYIKADGVPTLINRAGAIEQWDGKLGPGPLNASLATSRAMELAAENGIGLVSLAHTNHWMRGGAYGWQAAREGFVLICWTNTIPNMPAWGAKDPRLGNNPLIIAVPYNDEAIVLDIAMSQYSYGRLETYRTEGKILPYPGGYSKDGKLTDNPAEILESWRPLPAGYWKGSGLSLMLDILAAVLSGGLTTTEVGKCETDTDVSQVFIAIQIRALENYPVIQQTIDRIIEDLHKSVPENEAEPVRFPGENVIKTRSENQKEGIPVRKDIWERIKNL